MKNKLFSALRQLYSSPLPQNPTLDLFYQSMCHGFHTFSQELSSFKSTTTCIQGLRSTTQLKRCKLFSFCKQKFLAFSPIKLSGFSAIHETAKGAQCIFIFTNLEVAHDHGDFSVREVTPLHDQFYKLNQCVLHG